MKELQRYERALQIALGRMGVQGVAYVDWAQAVSALFDFYEEDGLEAVRDVYRLVNILEDLERQAGVQHVRVVRPEEMRAKALARLEALGYEVRVYPEVGPRDAEVGWIAMAFYEGRLVAHAYGDSKTEALQGLLGEVGA
ncbi:hypothetical protein [Thermus brevis]|uniref:hypothetical protein n=1 Tax=Thermus brevis TaxID=2862456 RepID=UPI001FE5FE63|nr:hypothetical protein [Thermus brevis]